MTGTRGRRHGVGRAGLGRGARPPGARRRGRGAGRAGLFRLVAPREVGGWEAALPVSSPSTRSSAAADPSAAWCVTNAAVAGRAAAYLDRRGPDRVFADPDVSYAFSNLVAGAGAPASGGTAATGRGGRWSVVSGAATPTWAVLGAGSVGADEGAEAGRSGPDGEAARGGGRRALDAACPASTSAWRRRGTTPPPCGGRAVTRCELTDTFVPEELAHSWSHPLRLDRPLYRLGRTSVTGTSSAAITLGVLRNATEPLAELLGGYRSTLDGAAPRDWANVQHTVAELAAARRAARAGLFEAATEVWAAAEASGGDVPGQSAGRAVRRLRPRRAGLAAGGQSGLRVRHRPGAAAGPPSRAGPARRPRHGRQLGAACGGWSTTPVASCWARIPATGPCDRRSNPPDRPA